MIRRRGCVKMNLLDAIRDECGRRYYSKRTASVYCTWTKSFWLHTNRKSPHAWAASDVQEFLTWMPKSGYSAVSQKQALNAIVFVFRHVTKRELGEIGDFARAKHTRRLPVILSRAEVMRILAAMRGQSKLMASLCYGAGLRIGEVCQLRVKDLDFDAGVITVRAGKGDKDRWTMLPAPLRDALVTHLQFRQAQHRLDIAHGAGWAAMPGRLAIKYPNAGREFAWQFVFASAVVRDQRRWYCTPRSVQHDFRVAVKSTGINKPATPHTLRHAFATHLVTEDHYDPRTVQELLGHAERRDHDDLHPCRRAGPDRPQSAGNCSLPQSDPFFPQTDIIDGLLGPSRRGCETSSFDPPIPPLHRPAAFFHLVPPLPLLRSLA